MHATRASPCPGPLPHPQAFSIIRAGCASKSCLIRPPDHLAQSTAASNCGSPSLTRKNLSYPGFLSTDRPKNRARAKLWAGTPAELPVLSPRAIRSGSIPVVKRERLSSTPGCLLLLFAALDRSSLSNKAGEYSNLAAVEASHQPTARQPPFTPSIPGLFCTGAVQVAAPGILVGVLLLKRELFSGVGEDAPSPQKPAPIPIYPPTNPCAILLVARSPAPSIELFSDQLIILNKRTKDLL